MIQISPPLVARQEQFDEMTGILGDVLSEAWERMLSLPHQPGRWVTASIQLRRGVQALAQTLTSVAISSSVITNGGETCSATPRMPRTRTPRS